MQDDLVNCPSTGRHAKRTTRSLDTIMAVVVCNTDVGKSSQRRFNIETRPASATEEEIAAILYAQVIDSLRQNRNQDHWQQLYFIRVNFVGCYYPTLQLISAV